VGLPVSAAAADPASEMRCNIQELPGATLAVWCTDPWAIVAGYQWERDGVAIPGATGPDYEYSAWEVGHLFTATVRIDEDGQELTVLSGRDPQDVVLAGHRRAAVAGMYMVSPETCAGTSSSGTSVDLRTTLAINPKIALPVSGVDYYVSWDLHGSNQVNPGISWYLTAPAFWDSQVRGDSVALSDLLPLGTLVQADQFWVYSEIVMTANGVRGIVPCPHWDGHLAGSPIDLGPFAGAHPASPLLSYLQPVSGTLTADVSGWPAGTTFTYQWTRDGQKIANATAASYTLTAADSEARIGVVVWGTLGGLTTWQWGDRFADTITDKPGSSTTTPKPDTTKPAKPDTTASHKPHKPHGSDKTKSDTTKPADKGSLAATGASALGVLVTALALTLVGAGVLVARRLRTDS